jgi:hypothetical protein
VYLEIKKCCIFSGCCLNRSEASMAAGDTNVAMLEGSVADEELG